MNFGISLSDFSASQKSFELINKCNDYVSKKALDSVSGFFENISAPCIIPNFPIFPMIEIWGFEGPIIANDLKSAEALINLQTGFPKYYYIWDLEWTQMQNPSFEKLLLIYNDKTINLITRSHDYAIAMKKLWNRECQVLEEFNLEKIYEKR